jgi:hypothetical protein
MIPVMRRVPRAAQLAPYLENQTQREFATGHDPFSIIRSYRRHRKLVRGESRNAFFNSPRGLVRSLGGSFDRRALPAVFLMGSAFLPPVPIH